MASWPWGPTKPLPRSPAGRNPCRAAARPLLPPFSRWQPGPLPFSLCHAVPLRSALFSFLAVAGWDSVGANRPSSISPIPKLSRFPCRFVRYKVPSQPHGLPFALRLPNRALDTLIGARLDLAVLRASRRRDAPLLLLFGLNNSPRWVRRAFLHLPMRSAWILVHRIEK